MNGKRGHKQAQERAKAKAKAIALTQAQTQVKTQAQAHVYRVQVSWQSWRKKHNDVNWSEVGATAVCTMVWNSLNTYYIAYQNELQLRSIKKTHFCLPYKTYLFA